MTAKRDVLLLTVNSKNDNDKGIDNWTQGGFLGYMVI